ncbi:MAG: hypothetical protein BGN82_01725 [Alphaproteobacteria bacterium 65-7]|nr:MAG: hypothetical protein BGN82_01725 [Alphaproteobacteria bacterium 65-7]
MPDEKVPDEEQSKSKLSVGGWVVIGALVALMVASGWYSLGVWNAIETEMSGMGWGMLIAGVVISLALGAGLMALLFYSSKHDYDR